MNRATEYETPNIIKINELFPTPYIVEFSANLIKKRLYYSTFINKNTEIAYCIFRKNYPCFSESYKTPDLSPNLSSASISSSSSKLNKSLSPAQSIKSCPKRRSGCSLHTSSSFLITGEIRPRFLVVPPEQYTYNIQPSNSKK